MNNQFFRDKAFIVTGGGGFIGQHLVAALLNQGCATIGVIDPIAELPIQSPHHERVVHYAHGFDEIEHAGRFLENFQRKAQRPLSGIFHMGVIPLRMVQEDPRRAIAVNIEGTHTIVELAHAADNCKIVFSSASSVYGETEEVMDESLLFNPTTFYGASKAASELWLMAALSEWQVPYISLRYMNVYGPWQAGGLIPFQIRRIQGGLGPRIEGDGSAEFDFVYSGDVVQANLLAMEAELSGRQYNVGSGEYATVAQICDRLQELAGTHYEPEFVPERPGAVRRRVGSIERIREELGYRPWTDLADGLRRTWEAGERAAAR